MFIFLDFSVQSTWLKGWELNHCGRVKSSEQAYTKLYRPSSKVSNTLLIFCSMSCKALIYSSDKLSQSTPDLRTWLWGKKVKISGGNLAECRNPFISDHLTNKRTIPQRRDLDQWVWKYWLFLGKDNADNKYYKMLHY